MSDSSLNANCYSLKVIGIVKSCYKEKFGVPRQAGLAPESCAMIELLPPYNAKDSIAGLESVSHIWLQFIFHLSLSESWRPKVRPPRLGGNQRLGVFATRSPVRPNTLGLSAVKLDKITTEDGRLCLFISGQDLVDGTPIVDIKPYVPYADCIANATNEIAPQRPKTVPVVISGAAKTACEKQQKFYSSNLVNLIHQTLEQDPRPAYQQLDTARVYGMALLDFDLKWRYQKKESSVFIEVLSLDYCQDEAK